MTGPELMAVIGFFIMLFGSIVGGYRYIETKLRFVFDRADEVEKDFAAYKTHVAETYVSKQGLRETRDEIMGAIVGVRSAVERMTERVDRIVENQPRRATRP